MADLTDTKLDAAFNVEELGTYVGNGTAWTSTNGSGEFVPDACVDWTSSSSLDEGRAGSVWNSSSFWSVIFNFDCDSNSRLYCISDPEPIFVDGFESGDVSAWSSSAP